MHAPNVPRRTFVQTTLATLGAWAIGGRLQAQSDTPPMSAPAGGSAPVDRARPTHDLALAKEFVLVCHRDLEKVKAMIAREPRLVYASVDTGNVSIGDWETGLNGASHLGRRDIAEFLLANGARMDAFAAAMLGYRDVVVAMIKADPRTATVKGPHNLTLLYHAAIGGEVAIAEAIKAHLAAGAVDFNQSLSAAARDGRVEMTKWLLENGATDVNAPDAFRKTPLQIATAKGFTEVAEVLRTHGAR